MTDVAVNFVDNIGMHVDAAYLNNLGAVVNTNSHARTLVGARSALPAAAASNTGAIYKCNDCAAEYYSDGSTWTKIRLSGFSSPGMADPPTTGLTTYGTGGTITTDADSRLLTTTGTNSVLNGEYKALSPTINYTARGYIEPAIILANATPGIRLGIAVFDSSGKAILWGINNTTAIAMSHWASSNSPTDVYSLALNSSSLYAIPNWYQIRDDGTNLNFEFSYNGRDWIFATSEARTTFLTAANVGWGAYWNLSAQTKTLKLRVRSLSVSTP
jgi:hypothetical protein